MQYNKQCTVCGLQFTSWNIKKATCSTACQVIYHRQNMVKRMRALRAREKATIDKVCIKCGITFKADVVQSPVCCWQCRTVNAQAVPKRDYDLNNVDSDGIIYGTITKS
jgi:predicted Zn-ribbon and HTH transcriptional regulator